jgi:hypothetical protein
MVSTLQEKQQQYHNEVLQLKLSLEQEQAVSKDRLLQLEESKAYTDSLLLQIEVEKKRVKGLTAEVEETFVKVRALKEDLIMEREKGLMCTADLQNVIADSHSRRERLQSLEVLLKQKHSSCELVQTALDEANTRCQSLILELNCTKADLEDAKTASARATSDSGMQSVALQNQSAAMEERCHELESDVAALQLRLNETKVLGQELLDVAVGVGVDEASSDSVVEGVQVAVCSLCGNHLAAASGGGGVSGLRLTNSGNAEVNGYYVPDGDYNRRPLWRHSKLPTVQLWWKGEWRLGATKSYFSICRSKDVTGDWISVLDAGPDYVGYAADGASGMPPKVEWASVDEATVDLGAGAPQSCGVQVKAESAEVDAERAIMAQAYQALQKALEVARVEKKVNMFY